MSRIPDELLEQILSKTDIGSVVGRHVGHLRRQGRRLVGLCPFHSERSPSFSVDAERGLWYCFGCQAGGSLLQFVMKAESLTFEQAAVKLGQEVGIEVKVSDKDDPAEKRRERLLGLLERCLHYYHEMLVRSPVGQAARDYLSERGISAQAIADFKLGWAPAGGTALLQRLEKSGYRAEEGLAVGVLRDRQGRAVDTLRERVVFPILDAQDRPLAFGGRILQQGQPKYLNTPETDFYSKRRHLFGLNLHRQAISKADRAVVVEGYLDVIALHQVGIPLAVASLGTSLTQEQAALLRRYSRDVIMAYDADRAGQVATLKGIELFEAAGLRVSIAPLPAGEDPDSLARKGGAEAIEAVLRDAQAVVDYHIARCEQVMDLSTPEGKEDFVREILPAIERVQDAVKRDAYVRRLAAKLRVTESQVYWKLSSRKPGQSARRMQSKIDPFDVETTLLRVLAYHPEWIRQVREQLRVEELTRESLRPLLAMLFATEGRDRPLGVQDLVAHVQDDGLSGEWIELLFQEPPATSSEDVEKLIKAVRDRSDRVRFEQIRAEITQALSDGTINPEDERYQEYIRLQRRLKGAQ